MDVQNLSQLFQWTFDSNLRAQAEAKLEEICKTPGFTSTVLQLVMAEDIPVPVRQGAVIYLKNMVTHHWRQWESDNQSEPTPYKLSDDDKTVMRQNIIEAIIHATELVRVQLTVCVGEMIRADFPEQWPDVIHKINQFLSTDSHDTLLGALIVLLQVVKKYEYKHENERAPLFEVMQMFLPILHNRCAALMKNDSAMAATIQAKILKIYRGMIQVNLPLNIINENNLPQWMGLFKGLLERPVPESTLQWDEDERPSLSWWKCKKWTINVVYKIFERYGCPGSVAKEYRKFADFYDKHFSESMMVVMLKIIDGYRQKQYIAPRVLQQTLNYIAQGVLNATSWKVIKPHVLTLIKEIIFPLMSHTEEDEELWQDNPQEFIKIKYDIFEDFLYLSPNAAAKSLLQNMVKKRKGILDPTVSFIMSVITGLADQVDPKQKDGALHMLGTLAEILAKKKAYKNHMEVVLVQNIFPEFQSPHGFLRGRACWVTRQFAVIQFQDKNVLTQTINLVMHCLANDKDLPVQVEAGIAIRYIIEKQDDAYDGIKPHVKVLVQQLLHILRETENEELTGTISKLIQDFSEEVTTIAVDLMSTLCATFMELVESDEDYDSKSVTAMGVLETIQTIVSEMDESKEVMAQLEQLVANLIVCVLRKQIMEFYEEIFSLINECTVVQVSPVMWNVLFLVCEAYDRDTSDYFTEMMPCLHNYVTVDPPAFLANPKYMEVMFHIVKSMLSSNPGEGAECQAAKLLEVIVVQYRGEINQWLPTFISLALERLTREVKTSELRVMCLLVVVGALYNNPALTLAHLEKIPFPNTTDPFTGHFITQWLNDADAFLGLHDRKLFVIGMCSMLATPAAGRPQSVNMLAPQFFTALIMIFQGLKRTYEKMTAGDNDTDSDNEDEEGELESDDDEYDEKGTEYVEMLQNKSNTSAPDDYDDDEDEYEYENDMDLFTTPIDENPFVDEYILFRNSFQAIKAQDEALYSLLTQSLTPEQQQQIQAILIEANAKEQLLQSRKIEQQGGYQFATTSVPTNFSFGGKLP